jgi:hypothetical protein
VGLVTVYLRSVLLLLLTADVPSSQIHFALMMEAIRSSETSAPTRATRHHIQKAESFMVSDNFLALQPRISLSCQFVMIDLCVRGMTTKREQLKKLKNFPAKFHF